eukprot:CAMPEP_0184686236 /NCGR_PEP_ID=MMETSP0312-20130426/21761_1 /TAXON_ID=31354 /ORGANISM="Compsopogon coeruleus, Strain SAG 36.94" /LENGTH=879 /DNA_ID=CAMNT_0027141125 /DNA_START=347 /DNA_END=2986 /DNA_ORIENTATION=-
MLKHVRGNRRDIQVRKRDLPLQVVTVLLGIARVWAGSLIVFPRAHTIDDTVLSASYPKYFDLLAGPGLGSVFPGIYQCDANRSLVDQGNPTVPLCRKDRRYPVATFYDGDGFDRAFGFEISSVHFSLERKQLVAILQESQYGAVALIAESWPLRELGFQKSRAIFHNVTFASRGNPWLESINKGDGAGKTGLSSVAMHGGITYFVFRGLFGQKRNLTREEIHLRALNVGKESCNVPRTSGQYDIIHCSSLIGILSTLNNPFQDEVLPLSRAGRTLLPARHERTLNDVVFLTLIHITGEQGTSHRLVEVNLRSRIVRTLRSDPAPKTPQQLAIASPLSSSLVHTGGSLCWIQELNNEGVVTCSKLGTQFPAAISHPMRFIQCNWRDASIFFVDAIGDRLAAFCPSTGQLHVASVSGTTSPSVLPVAKDMLDSNVSFLYLKDTLSDSRRNVSLRSNLWDPAPPLESAPSTGLLFSTPMSAMQLPGVYGCRAISAGQCQGFEAQYVGAQTNTSSSNAQQANAADGFLYLSPTSLSVGIGRDGRRILLGFDRDSSTLFLSPLPARQSGLIEAHDLIFRESRSYGSRVGSLGAFAILDGRVIFTVSYKDGIYSSRTTAIEIRQLSVELAQGTSRDFTEHDAQGNNDAPVSPNLILPAHCWSRNGRLYLISCSRLLKSIANIAQTHPDVDITIQLGTDLVLSQSPDGTTAFYTTYTSLVRATSSSSNIHLREVTLVGGTLDRDSSSLALDRFRQSFDSSRAFSQTPKHDAHLTADAHHLCWTWDGYGLACMDTQVTPYNATMRKIFLHPPKGLCGSEFMGGRGAPASPILTALASLPDGTVVVGCSTGAGTLVVDETGMVRNVSIILGRHSPVIQLVVVPITDVA